MPPLRHCANGCVYPTEAKPEEQALLTIPPIVEAICRAVADAGGQAWLVGGVVRDHLLGIATKDFDIEVHSLEAEVLREVLSSIGSVNEVGRSFGVFKLDSDGICCDVSIPRHDSQTGESHKDITVVGNPYMGIEAAARRRDLTINAIALDPLSGEIADPFGGGRDIERGRLRAVDPKTFVEDPLRAVRVVQFAARLGFSVDPKLAELCRQASLWALPPERIWAELEKMLLRAPTPSIGWTLMDELGLIEKVLPDVISLPVGPVSAALDRAAERRDAMMGTGRQVSLMLSTLLHQADRTQVDASLDRLNLHKHHSYPVRKRVLELTQTWPEVAVEATDTTLRRLADHTELALLTEVAAAVSGGTDALRNLDRAVHLGISTDPMPVLLKGKDLTALGLVQGPGMGEAMRAVRGAQIEGEVSDRDGAIIWLKDHLK